MNASSPTDDQPVTRQDLERIFVDSEKPAKAWLIGGEAEKFAVDSATGAPLEYDGPRGVRRIFDNFVTRHGWLAERETEDGPIVALTRRAASITLEPGAQLELSGAPFDSVHEVVTEMREHLDELADITKELGLTWLGVGFQPLAAQADLSWVPKHRYGVMKRYLPTRGSRGLDMMRRTATVQANYDYATEEDAMQKLMVLLRLSPIMHAMMANSPFVEGRVGANKSERGAVWLDVDASRSGLIPALWDKEKPRYSDYVEWALDAGMFLFRRDGAFVHNTGQTFRDFLENGYEGHRATFGDWALHLNTLFPEARLKRTLEARSVDCLPLSLVGAMPALATGLLYDPQSLGRATELSRRFDFATVNAARPELIRRGLEASIGGVPARRIAEEIIELADAGLARRARLDKSGKDERVHLAKLGELVAAGKCPADVLLAGLEAGATVPPAEIIRRSHI